MAETKYADYDQEYELTGDDIRMLVDLSWQNHEKVDVSENRIHSLDERLLVALLKDRSTGKNILWCTSNYARYGKKFINNAEIKIELITGLNGNIIRPRTKKGEREQKKRIRDKAEVFTPSWVCNAQNNLIDDAWLKLEHCFNVESDRTWITTTARVPFEQSGKTWQDYVLDKRLEISCGEAPYLVSRYDTVTGEIIEPRSRIGILDRKIRVVNENAGDGEWFVWTKRAFQSTYGYEWQGDSLLIARENLLYTFCDYYFERYRRQPGVELQREIAEVISWNIWQMDGLKGVVPDSCITKTDIQFSFFGEEKIECKCEGCLKNDIYKHTGIYCKVRDWTAIEHRVKSTIRFVDLFDRGSKR